VSIPAAHGRLYKQTLGQATTIMSAKQQKDGNTITARHHLPGVERSPQEQRRGGL